MTHLKPLIRSAVMAVSLAYIGSANALIPCASCMMVLNLQEKYEKLAEDSNHTVNMKDVMVAGLALAELADGDIDNIERKDVESLQRITQYLSRKIEPET